MTNERYEQLRDLISQVQRVAYYAQDERVRLPYRLAVAISRADDLQGEIFQFIDELRPADPTSHE